MSAQEPKPGYQTTEFWVVILTALLPLLTLIFHKDFTAQVQTWAAAAAGLATVIYTISRSFVKSSYARAASAGSASDGAAVTSAVTKSGNGAVHPLSIQETLTDLNARLHALEDEVGKIPGTPQ